LGFDKGSSLWKKPGGGARLPFADFQHNGFGGMITQEHVIELMILMDILT
jgi:hypothetical protein